MSQFLIIAVFSLSFAFTSEAVARERVRVDQALNQSLKESSAAQKPMKKRQANRKAQSAKTRTRTVDIEIGEAGAIGVGSGLASSDREESIAWRTPDSVSTEKTPGIGALDAEASSIKIEPDKEGLSD